jgi:hypothetical protein
MKDEIRNQKHESPLADSKWAASKKEQVDSVEALGFIFPISGF